jgi:hypothetical protein
MPFKKFAGKRRTRWEDVRRDASQILVIRGVRSRPDGASSEGNQDPGGAAASQMELKKKIN